MHRCAENTVINEKKKKNLIVITLLVFSVTDIGMHSLHCRISDIYGNTIILSSLHYPHVLTIKCKHFWKSYRLGRINPNLLTFPVHREDSMIPAIR